MEPSWPGGTTLSPVDFAAYLHRLLESATDYAIFSLDPDRRVLMWSAGAERIFGHAELQILGQSADILFTPEDRAAGAPEAEARQAVESGRSEDERWHMRRDGTRFYASGVTSRLNDAAGRHIGFVKIARDLTERKLANEQIRQARDELEQRVRERTSELEAANATLRAEIERRRIAEASREQLLKRIVRAEEDERLRLARELHDELGQHLAALMLRLNALESCALAGGQQLPLRDAQALTETIGREIHRIAVQLRPTALDDLGLAGAIGSYAELWSAQSGIPVRTQLLNVEEPRLPRELEVALYRIVQEALTNILKHAAASSVGVVVSRADGHVAVVVEDNGRGFDPGAVAASPKGLGLLGMRERIAQFGGRFEIESAPGGGTTLYVRVPMERT